MTRYINGFHYQKLSSLQFRYLSSSEVSTALRPFYFLVHPDLFGQHPRAQIVNDTSLKLLNSHIDCLINNKKPKPIQLQFYIKNQFFGDIKLQSLQLNRSNIKETVCLILSTFDLPTQFLDSIPEKTYSVNREIKWHNSYYAATGLLYPEEEFVQQKEDDLFSWLLKNIEETERRQKISHPIRKDIERLKDSIIAESEVHSLTWERGLGTTHLRGCLQGLKALVSQHPNVRSLLRGRTVHFGNQSGISLEGSILLSTSEVRDQWLHMISQAPSYEFMVERLPYMQNAVSNSLLDIKVTYRKYQPHILANCYSHNLRRLVTSLGDFRSHNGFPSSWPKSLSHLQLVVESAASPLMLSPTGQIIAPSSCPPWLLINFITENMEEAFSRIIKYENDREQEKILHAECMNEFDLEFLEKDDSILTENMTNCLTRLVHLPDKFSSLLSGARIWITQYYSVMIDGEMCIPWNWK